MMVDLKTEYLGLSLKNPLVPSSSPLTGNLDDARRLEDYGAAALILPSLFEEALINEQENMSRFIEHQDIGHAEADSFLPAPPTFHSTLDQYLEKVERYKGALSIPVIGSLNGTTASGWIDHARDLESAGCDAIELNLYSINANRADSSDDIERRYLKIVHELSRTIRIPFTVKLSPQITSLTHFVNRLEQAGAQGVSLFNRFYQPDIDLDTLTVAPRLQLSSSYECLLRIHWIALLRPQVKLGLAATGGFHDHRDALKALLAGADVVHLCSLLLAQGPEAVQPVLQQMIQWMEDKEYQSVQQLKGSLSYQHAVDPSAYERANYLQVLDSYTPAPG
ncbi:MAG: dihydroorotate dehydrogenase-like protein, partial [Ketobacteraceae bacterium]|nr:dihydroorotate dehydrogenase-like protein [Ketobacteraceae bacterium]